MVLVHGGTQCLPAVSIVTRAVDTGGGILFNAGQITGVFIGHGGAVGTHGV